MDMQTGRNRSADGRTSVDRGVTLIEVVISIALTGGVVIAILGAVFTVVRSTNQNAQATRIQAVVGAAGDQLNSVEWEPCPDDSDRYDNAVAAAADRVGWSPSSVTIESIDHWNPGSGSWSSDCSGAASLGTSETLQRVTIRVTAPDGSQDKTFDIVKSNTTPFSMGAAGA